MLFLVFWISRVWVCLFSPGFCSARWDNTIFINARVAIDMRGGGGGKRGQNVEGCSTALAMCELEYRDRFVINRIRLFYEFEFAYYHTPYRVVVQWQ
jgi:hypothetical protein